MLSRIKKTLFTNIPRIHSSYLSRPPRPAVVYFFQGIAPFSIENAKFWPFLAILSRTYALSGAPLTGLYSAVVPQNWQIWGMPTPSRQSRWGILIHLDLIQLYSFARSNVWSQCHNIFHICFPKTKSNHQKNHCWQTPVDVKLQRYLTSRFETPTVCKQGDLLAPEEALPAIATGDGKVGPDRLYTGRGTRWRQQARGAPSNVPSQLSPTRTPLNYKTRFWVSNSIWVGKKNNGSYETFSHEDASIHLSKIITLKSWMESLLLRLISRQSLMALYVQYVIFVCLEVSA